MFISGDPLAFSRRVAPTMINMAKEFSPAPEGVTIKDGDANAERFRKDFLVKALHADPDKPVVVVLNGLHHAPSAAFVEAAFGGLVSQEGCPKDDLRRRLAFSNNDATDHDTRALALHCINAAV